MQHMSKRQFNCSRTVLLTLKWLYICTGQEPNNWNDRSLLTKNKKKIERTKRNTKKQWTQQSRCVQNCKSLDARQFQSVLSNFSLNPRSLVMKNTDNKGQLNTHKSALTSHAKKLPLRRGHCFGPVRCKKLYSNYPGPSLRSFQNGRSIKKHATLSSWERIF